MSENSDDVEETSAVRLQRLARHLRNSLAFAAPEIWALHILESLGAAFDLGRASAEKSRCTSCGGTGAIDAPPEYDVSGWPCGGPRPCGACQGGTAEDDTEQRRRGA